MRISTIVLLILLAAAAWAGYQITVHKDTSEPTWKLEKPLLTFHLKDVGEIHMQRNRESAIVRPIDTVWHLIEPVYDRLDLAAAQSIFFGLNGMQVYDVISAEEFQREGWNDVRFGLGDNAVHVIIKDPDGNVKHELAIGDVTPWIVDDIPTMYVRRGPPGSTGDIFIVGGNLRTLLDRPFDQLRAREVLFLPRPPSTIRISRGEEILELSHDAHSDDWHLVRPLSTRANNTAVRQLLEAMAHSETNQFTDPSADFPSTGDIIRVNISLSPPASTTTHVMEKESQTDSIELIFDTLIDIETDRIRVRCSDRRYDLHVPADILESLALEPNRFRSRELTNINPDEIFEIIIRSDEFNVHTLERYEDEWFLNTRTRLLQADQDRILDSIEKINQTPILSFADDNLTNASDFGLDKPTRTATFIMKNGEQTILHVGRRDNDVYANIEGTPFIFEVPSSLLGILPDTPTPWRSRLILNFSSFDLQQIHIQPQNGKETILRQNVQLGLWVATLNGKDVTNHINFADVSDVIAQLERLRVERWLASPSQALTVLANPDWTIKLQITETNPDGSILSRNDMTLDFSMVSTDSPFYFGRINKGADVFLIQRHIVESITRGFLHPEAFED